MKQWVYYLLIISLITVLAACGTDEQENQDGLEEQEPDTAEDMEEDDNANATEEEEVLVSLIDTEGNMVATATLVEEDSGVTINLEGENLPPGTHGFHIHEEGACEEPDFESAGGHYNPTDANHGFDDPDGPHAGDLPNIEVSEDGTVTEEVKADMVTLVKDEDNSLYKDGGTALVIHSEADDYSSQPAGEAGERIACGVISE
ncbi:superoxide dismutase family protein [Virgibacillus sp. C22-A2]|uniref:Superoxide dismutase family protein n=1 Tax=Virgibacillus tibetensis TaxID=3042313 RepID=A0ABU6KI36_9BACI|nr:superoxide dismutase family protein [Virgibacillus sp. C22-A2]